MLVVQENTAEVTKWLETNTITKCPTVCLLKTKGVKLTSKDRFLLKRHQRLQNLREEIKRQEERKIVQSFF